MGKRIHTVTVRNINGMDQVFTRESNSRAYTHAVVVTVTKAERDANLAKLQAEIDAAQVAPALVKNTNGKATHVKVKLEADDTYTVESIRYARRGLTVTINERTERVYADQLRSVVESMTGLRLTLGTMGAS